MSANKKNKTGGEFEMRKDDPFDEAMKVASSSECTGLMPALPATEQEDVNIVALYAIHKAKEMKKKKSHFQVKMYPAVKLYGLMK